MKIDDMPEKMREKWFKAAREQYSKKPITECREYELEALQWYYDLMLDWDEQPQSYNEALMWHQYNHNLAQVNLELAKRRAERCERWLRDWEAKGKKSEAGNENA